MSKGLGIVERAILAELPVDDKWQRVTWLSWAVAKKLGWGIWTIQNHMAKLREEKNQGTMSKEEYAMLVDIVPKLHGRYTEKLEPKFNATFSRALKRLEEKGYLDRVNKIEITHEGENNQTIINYSQVIYSTPRHTKTTLVRRKFRADVNT